MGLLRRSYIQYLRYMWPVHRLAFVRNTFYTPHNLSSLYMAFSKTLVYTQALV